MDRLGENISIIKENGIQYKYVLVPKALLNDLIFKITYSFIETNTIFKATTPTLSPIFTRPEKARRTCHIFMYWINAQQYLRTCGSAHFAEVIPEELSYYNVEQDDRISIPLNVFNALNPKYRTLLTKLRNIFMIDSQQSEGETSAESAEHKLIKKRLTEIGRRIGFEAVSEFDVGDFRLDVAWLEGDEIAYAFEVVVSGSLLEALYRLEHVNARKRVLIVNDEKLEKAKEKTSSGIRIIPASIVLNEKIHEIIERIMTQ